MLRFAVEHNTPPSEILKVIHRHPTTKPSLRNPISTCISLPWLMIHHLWATHHPFRSHSNHLSPSYLWITSYKNLWYIYGTGQCHQLVHINGRVTKLINICASRHSLSSQSTDTSQCNNLQKMHLPSRPQWSTSWLLTCLIIYHNTYLTTTINTLGLANAQRTEIFSFNYILYTIIIYWKQIIDSGS